MREWLGYMEPRTGRGAVAPRVGPEEYRKRNKDLDEWRMKKDDEERKQSPGMPCSVPERRRHAMLSIAAQATARDPPSEGRTTSGTWEMSASCECSARRASPEET